MLPCCALYSTYISTSFPWREIENFLPATDSGSYLLLLGLKSIADIQTHYSGLKKDDLQGIFYKNFLSLQGQFTDKERVSLEDGDSSSDHITSKP
jgi:hypothetical protein